MSRLVVVGPAGTHGPDLLERAAARLGDLEVELVVPGADEARLVEVGGEPRVAVGSLGALLEPGCPVICCGGVPAGVADRLREHAASALVVDIGGELGGEPVDARSTRALPLSGLVASPPAGVLALAALARAAHRAGAESPLAAVVLEPASELGRAAMDELHAQAVAVLNFTEMPTERFGRQAVHDLQSPGAGGAAREEQLAAQAAALVGEEVPAPSVLLVQAGTFHGTAVAARAATSAAALERAITGEPRLGRHGEGGGSVVASIGAASAVVARLRDDGQGAAWAWITADTLEHGAVANAVELVAAATTGPPST